MGTLRTIWIKRSRRGRMDRRAHADAITGSGLEGNADRGGRRQVTILASEAWSTACAELGVDVPPEARRANLLVDGIELADSRGRTLRVGPIEIRIFGETRPCERMDEACRGLREALDPPWRAGAFGEVTVGGHIAVGDRVEWVEKDGASTHRDTSTAG